MLLNSESDASMKQLKFIANAILVITLTTLLGCASSPTHEGTGQYVDDAVITSKVKYAVLSEETLKSSEINVETYKGIVQLTGFVSSEKDILKAVEVATAIKGVKSVKNDMRLKANK